MANDIFDSNVTIGNGWKLEGAIIDFGEHNKDLLATSLQIQYNRQTEQINPINDDARYIIASDPQGTAQIGAVVGPSADIAGFIKDFGNVCNIAGSQLIIKPTGTQVCTGTTFSAKSWTCSGCLITGVSLNIQKTNGGNMVIANLTMSFLKLEIGDGDTDSTSAASAESSNAAIAAAANTA